MTSTNRLSLKDQNRIIRFFTKESRLSAYWAGVILADGSLSRAGSILSLVSIDYDHLVSYCQDLKISPEVFVGTRTRPISENHSQQYVVKLSIPGLGPPLSKWGIVPNKTYEFKSPHFNLQFFSNFLRGLLDGDGHRSGPDRWRLVGNGHLMDWLSENRPRSVHVLEHVKKKEAVYKRLTFTGNGLNQYLKGARYLRNRRRLLRKWP